ncbi:hypothetical protein ACJIZ3_016196 [Penstemon smallii]|uniref:Uncharacterized protein n=1 Tax=Penstemon smallii TaxID=265156 RepID=A0ABD3RPX1_9LAMI
MSNYHKSIGHLKYEIILELLKHPPPPPIKYHCRIIFIYLFLFSEIMG